jgi:hypothetical protein
MVRFVDTSRIAYVCTKRTASVECVLWSVCLHVVQQGNKTAEATTTTGEGRDAVALWTLGETFSARQH